MVKRTGITIFIFPRNTIFGSMGLNLFIISIRIVLWFFIAYLIYQSLQVILREPVWGPIDETAHMDYVEKISNFNITMRTDAFIENEVYQSFQYTRWAKPDTYDGTIQSAGLVALSYELHQPPLYYLLMAIPNRIMKIFQVRIDHRVMVLRIISWLIFLVGLLMGFVGLKYILDKYKFSVSYFVSQLFVIYMLLVGSTQRFGVSNDWLSLCIVNVIIYLMAHYYFERKYKLIPWIHFFIVALLLTKQTYLPMAFIFIALGWYYSRSFIRWRWYMMMYLFAVIWYVYFFIYLSRGSISHTFFNLLIPAGWFQFNDFMLILLHSVFNWKSLINYYPMPNLIVLYLFLLSFVTILFFKKARPLFVFSTVVLVFLAVMMFLLNKWIGGVHWYAYRHFNGYGIFIFMGAFAWLIHVLHWLKLYIQRLIC